MQYHQSCAWTLTGNSLGVNPLIQDKNILKWYCPWIYKNAKIVQVCHFQAEKKSLDEMDKIKEQCNYTQEKK